MDIASYLAIAAVLICFSALIFTRYAADIILMGGVTALLVVGVITPTEALSGFANQGMITVAMLFIVAQGLSKTGGAA